MFEWWLRMWLSWFGDPTQPGGDGIMKGDPYEPGSGGIVSGDPDEPMGGG